MKSILALVSVGCAVGLSVRPAPAAPGIETYVLTVSGDSFFGTYGPPPPIAGFFQGFGPSLPANGQNAGGVTGGTERLQTSTTGPLSDSSSASGSGSNFVASGAVSCSASYFRFGAVADATMSGGGNPFAVVAFGAYGKARDTFTFSSPGQAAGSAGFVAFSFTVSGNATFPGSGGVSELELAYQLNTANPAYAMRLYGYPTSASIDPNAGAFTFTPSSVAGSGVYSTAHLPMTWGTSFDFAAGLIASVIPSGGTGGVHFGNGATLTGIHAFDAAGNPVATFTIASGSGTKYSPTGVVPACPGDVDGDNIVNTVDLGALLGHFGTSVPPFTNGDLNGDGVVNTVDLGTLLGRFGSTCP